MRVALIVCVIAGSAAAQDNDLQLWRLGHPDKLNCTACDGTQGDPSEAGDVTAQARFQRLTSTLGLAFAPPFQEPAASLGQAGFELGLTSTQAFLRIPAQAWPTAGTHASGAPPKVLVLPTVTLRKGLGGSFELGASLSWLANSTMAGLSAELRWVPLDGVAYAPDLGFRAWGTRVVGATDVDLTVGGADAQLSKSWGLGGMVKLQPYVTGGVAFVNALSAVIDFKPLAENNLNPTSDDGIFRTVSFFHNSYVRGSLGLRLVAGAAVLGVEGTLQQGKNPIQNDSFLTGECAVASNCAPQFLRLWSLSGRLGFAY